MLKQQKLVTIPDIVDNRREGKKLCDVLNVLLTAGGQADEIPSLLRRLFRLPGFRTRVERMGKVVLLSSQRVRYYQAYEDRIHIIGWPDE